MIYYTRRKEFDCGQSDKDIRPRNGVCGGGMNAKALNFLSAVDGAIKGDLSEVHGVVLVDPLALSQESGPDAPERVQEYCQSVATKILWCEEQEIIRMNAKHRVVVLEHTDTVTVCNQYLQSIIAEYDIESEVLYTPIDHLYYKPAVTKKRQIVVMGQVSYAKNTPMVIEVFDALRDKDIEPIFVGNALLWGMLSRESDAELEPQLKDVCTHFPALSHSEVAQLLSESWAYLNIAKYDVGSLAFIEAGLSGCHVFASKYHRQFDEYTNVIRPTMDSQVVVDTICQHLDEFSGEPNLLLRKELMKKHAYSVFRAKLRQIVGDAIVRECLV